MATLKEDAQKKFLEQILGLKEKNPELDVKFCVDSNDVLEYGWTFHKITKVEICPWYESSGFIHTDESSILEYFEYHACDNGIPESEVESYAKKRYAEDVCMAICVFTHSA